MGTSKIIYRMSQFPNGVKAPSVAAGERRGAAAAPGTPRGGKDRPGRRRPRAAPWHAGLGLARLGSARSGWSVWGDCRGKGKRRGGLGASCLPPPRRAASRRSRAVAGENPSQCVQGNANLPQRYTYCLVLPGRGLPSLGEATPMGNPKTAGVAPRLGAAAAGR